MYHTPLGTSNPSYNLLDPGYSYKTSLGRLPPFLDRTDIRDEEFHVPETFPTYIMELPLISFSSRMVMHHPEHHSYYAPRGLELVFYFLLTVSGCLISGRFNLGLEQVFYFLLNASGCPIPGRFNLGCACSNLANLHDMKNIYLAFCQRLHKY